MMSGSLAKLKSALGLAGVFLLALGSVHAEDPEGWAVMVEPSFMDHFVRRPVPGSDRTILTVARMVDGQPQFLTREEKRGMAITFEEIEEKASATVEKVLQKITPDVVRDNKGVIAFVVLASEDPLTASTVLAPDFASRFRDQLGPDLLVAMPNRFQVFVFSRQDTVYQRMGDTIVSAYHSSDYPVSREVFVLERGRLRSLGPYQ